jgi:hypothetical protein
MADLPPDSDSNAETGGDSGTGSDRESTRGTPRWVKVFGIIGLALALLMGLMLLTGHGPGRHLRHGSVGGHIPPSSATSDPGNFTPSSPTSKDPVPERLDVVQSDVLRDDGQGS